MSVGDICTRVVFTISEEATVVEAARMMRTHQLGTLVVTVDRPGGEEPVGIITDRDIAVKAVATSPERLEQLLVGDLVFQEMVTVEEDASIWQVLQRMRNRGIRRMPVIDNAGFLMGIVTLDDVLLRISEELSAVSQILQRQSRIASELGAEDEEE